MHLSVVIPIKDERDNLRPLHERLRHSLDPLATEYELVFVDDGSADGSFAVLEELALRALRRDLAEALPLYGEMHRFVPVLAQQHGARLIQVPVRHHPRVAGKTKYTLSRTFRVLLDLITVKFLHSYLTRPMHVLGLGGLLAMGLGGVSLLATVWMKSHSSIFMTGNPLLYLSVMLEIVGVQLISMGLL